jgi:hypothetical protein
MCRGILGLALSGGRVHLEVAVTREGFPRWVVWLLSALFVVAVLVTAYWWWLNIRDVWILQRPLVAGRFDERGSLLVTAATLAAVAIPSGLLFAHYKRADSYGAPWELFFGIVFALTAILAAITVVPALL